MIPILSGNVASALGGTYEVANSCRFDKASSPSLSKTSGTPTNALKWTFSAWVKISSIGNDTFLLDFNTDGNNRSQIGFQDTDKAIIVYEKVSGSTSQLLQTSAQFRDPTGWLNIVVSCDRTLGTDTERTKIYVNGTRLTSFSTADGGPNYPAQNTNGIINTAVSTIIGKYSQSTLFYDGYLAEVVFIDGTAYDASNFGEFDEDSPTIWKPKNVSTLTFGNNGFYLDFEDSSNLGNDANGGTDFTETNIDATDQATDTCTNNFATMNPLDNQIQNQTFSQGNLQTLSDNPAPATSTIGLTSGKWWIEAKAVSTSGSGSDYQIGIVSNQVIATEDIGHYSNNYQYYYNGQIRTGNSGSSYGDTYTHGDIIGVALNLDDNELQFYKNGTVQNSGTAISITAPASTSLGAYFFALGADANANKYTWYINFGNPIYSLSSAVADANGYGSFEHAPPSGFFSVCTKNLAEYGG